MRLAVMEKAGELGDDDQIALIAEPLPGPRQIGMASVKPNYLTPRAAEKELDEAIEISITRGWKLRHLGVRNYG